MQVDNSERGGVFFLFRMRDHRVLRFFVVVIVESEGC